MKEDFLHYVWQHQYFDKVILVTNDQEVLQVLKIGFLNSNAGPDFLGAQIKINEVIWNGSVEVHLKSSDWIRHHHNHDPKYEQVILHVVWENDQVISRMDETKIPTLELKNRVSPALLQNYLNLKANKNNIPCSPFLAKVAELPKMAMADRVLIERLEEKAARITILWQNTTADWEETTYQALLNSFGFKINQEPFLRLAKILPFSVIRRHQHQYIQLEALLFGQAGFLEDVRPEDDYLKRLQQEFTFLKHKYSLSTGLKKADWNFFRLRPANFPTIRLAQLAAFLFKKEHLFSTLLELQDPKKYISFFEGTISGYWQTHYLPGKPSKSKNKNLGLPSIENIIINTIVPLLFAYGCHQDNQSLINRAILLLEELKPEDNYITRVYEDLAFKHISAADSQAYLQLYHNYCLVRNCLYCTIGHQILKQNLACS